MAAKDKEEGVRQLGSCFEVLSAAIEFDRKSRDTMKIRLKRLEQKPPTAASPETDE